MWGSIFRGLVMMLPPIIIAFGEGIHPGRLRSIVTNRFEKTSERKLLDGIVIMAITDIVEKEILSKDKYYWVLHSIIPSTMAKDAPMRKKRVLAANGIALEAHEDHLNWYRGLIKHVEHSHGSITLIISLEEYTMADNSEIYAPVDVRVTMPKTVVIDVENFQKEREEGGNKADTENCEIKINWTKVKEMYEDIYKKVNIM
jgi:hypothetical protein